jgi:hypothetical protein
MKIEIHIDNQEIRDIINSMKEQGVDVTKDDVEYAMKEYVYGAIEDSKEERFDGVSNILHDFED